MQSPAGRRPVLPALEELQRHVPAIEPVAGEGPRPYWSVMIPTYNSGPWLRQTLESVLAEDQGPARMQIEVIDGGSREDDPEPVVHELGAGRVGFHRLAENRGPAATFNACIAAARGEWVHILHGDDLVMPGFYEAYGATIAAVPDAAMVVGQSITFDARGAWRAIEGPIPPAGGGLLEGFATRVATDWLAHFPSVVFRRATYEAVGGYCTWFKVCCDWDMWMRGALHGPVACVPRPYAKYRWHEGSQTSQNIATGNNVYEAWVVVASNLERLERAGRPRPKDLISWRIRHAEWADRDAAELGRRGNAQGRLAQARWAWRLQPNRRRLRLLLAAWLAAGATP